MLILNQLRGKGYSYLLYIFLLFLGKGVNYMTVAIKRETKYGEQVILLDDEDYKIIEQFKLPLKLIRDKSVKSKDKFYVEIRKTVNSKIYRCLLHRLIMNCPQDKVIDHINGNPLDNRKCNLRIVTQQENCLNRNYNPIPSIASQLEDPNIIIKKPYTKLPQEYQSNVKGVKWHRASRKWKATIKVNKKYYYLGLFQNVEDAIKARKEAEKKYLE